MEKTISSNSTNEITSIISTSLNSVNKETREKVFSLVQDPLFTPVYDISIKNQKVLAQERLKKISAAKLVSVRDFRNDPENIFTMHEMVRY